MVPRKAVAAHTLCFPAAAVTRTRTATVIGAEMDSRACYTAAPAN
jgi:hypothetical protein